MSVSEMLTEIKEMVEMAEADAVKADNGNKAAGTRVRKAMQQITAQAKELRKEVLLKR